MKKFTIPCIAIVFIVWMYVFTHVRRQEKNEDAAAHRTTTSTEEKMINGQTGGATPPVQPSVQKDKL
ncbi:MAG: hypothetical protein WCD79_01555 [Chthoniobacteraceae bacterium]